jgi:hypothetical protein
MACVVDVPLGIALEGHAERHREGERDALPGIEGEAAALATLRAADRHPTEPDSLAELGLGEVTALPRVADDPPEDGQLLGVEAGSFDLEVRTPAAWHDRVMVIFGAYLPLTCRAPTLARPDDRAV